MSLGLTINMESEGVVGKRLWSDISKKALTEVASTWEQKYLKLHFRSFSSAKYGYQRRAQSTQKRKRRDARRGRAKKGGAVALVHTGLLEEQMMRSGSLRVFPKRFTLSKPGASYLTNSPRNGRPNMMKELASVTASETRQMGKIYKDSTVKSVSRVRTKTNKKLGG